MGSGCILAKSFKVKLNTKSSTESELVADNLAEALFIHFFQLTFV